MIVSYELIARVFDGHVEGLTRDDVLEQHHALLVDEHGDFCGTSLLGKQVSFFEPKSVSIPVAVSIFPDEIDAVPRSWAERAYPKLIHDNKLDKGGHFAAWEQPELLTEELRVAFRTLH